MWVVRVEANQNGSSLTHYDVKGMKWGVRKEYEKVSHLPATGLTLKEKSLAKVKASNKGRVTSDTKVKENRDGSVSVSGLKGIWNAKFTSKEVYQKWLDGDTNPFSEDINANNPIIRVGDEKISVGTPQITGSGYTLTFGKDNDYTAYCNDLERAKIQLTLSYSNNASLANKLAKWERGEDTKSYSDSKRSEYERKLAETYSALEFKGYKESLKNQVDNYSGLTYEERQDLYNQIDEMVVDDYYSYLDPSIMQVIEEEDKKRKKISKDPLFNVNVIKKGKDLLNKDLSAAIYKKVANDKTLAKSIEVGAKSVRNSIKSIGSNAIKSVTSSLSNVAKKISKFFGR